MVRRALITGLEYEGTSSEIGGPFNDIDFWAEFLTKRGYQLTILKEQMATKNNIKAQFKNLMKAANTGDQIFFSYSGHGGQSDDSSDSDRDEADDHEDEHISPYGGKVDDDFFRKYIAKLKSGVVFNGFICACHAGTSFDLRYNGEYYRKNGGKIYKSTTYTNYDNLSPQVVLLSACRDNGSTYTYKYNGQKHGLLTASFIDRFDEAYTYRKLLRAMWYFHEDVGAYEEDGDKEVIPHLSYGKPDEDDLIVNYGPVLPTETRETFFENYKTKNTVFDSDGNQLAFDGAEGYGCFSEGGRGGNAYWVTSLDDTDIQSGTLRYAIEQKGRPLYVFFDVDGVITLTKKLEIETGHITIDGLSPFVKEGITLTGAGLSVNGHAEHVIIRNLRIRPHLERDDAISIRNCSNVIVDHCSASWSGDEVITVNSSYSSGDPYPTTPLTDYVTVQNCFICEPFGYIEDDKRKHQYGSIISSTDGGKVSFLKNLYAHCNSRNPRLGNSLNDASISPCFLEFSGNLVYNWGGTPGYNGEDNNSYISFNYRKNNYIPGPDTDDNDHIFVEKGTKNSRGYFNKNLLNGDMPSDHYSLVKFKNWDQAEIDEYKQTEKLPIPNTHLVGGETALTYGVLSNAGVVAPKRDINDTRIICEVINKKGKIVTNPDDYNI
jgi:pectate lyase